MKVEIELRDDVAAAIEAEASMLGITSLEVLRRLVGLHCLEMKPMISPPMPQMIGPIPIRFAAPSRSMAIASRLLMEQMVKSGGLKCPNCTLPLSMESLEKGECGSCKAKLGGEEIG